MISSSSSTIFGSFGGKDHVMLSSSSSISSGGSDHVISAQTRAVMSKWGTHKQSKVKEEREGREANLLPSFRTADMLLPLRH